MGSAFLKWCNYAFCSLQEWAGGVLQAGMVLLGDTAGLLPYMGKHLNWLRRLEFRGVTSQPTTSPRIWIKKFHFFLPPLAGIWTSGIFPRKRGKPRRLTFCSLGSGVRDRSCWIGRSWICEGGDGGVEKATFACGSSSFSPVLFACWRNFAGTRFGIHNEGVDSPGTGVRRGY